LGGGRMNNEYLQSAHEYNSKLIAFARCDFHPKECHNASVDQA